MTDKDLYNIYNNIFKSQREFDRIYRMVENEEHRRDKRLKKLKIEDGLLYYEDDDKKLRVVSKTEMPEFLEAIYNKIERYGLGINKLNDVVKELFLGITRKDLINFLKNKPKFQLNQPLYKTGRNNPVITRKANQLWQADHLHLTSFSNQRYKYILTCIDHFSKFAWVVPVTSLDSRHTIDAFKEILSETDSKPKLIQVDGGIYNDKNLQNYMEEEGIKLKKSSSYTPTENGLVENFNRQLRMRIYSGFIHHENKQWKDFLSDYVRGWNDTKHGTTKYKPNQIYGQNISAEMKKEIIDNTMKASKFKKEKPLEIGDWVRISTPAFYSYIKAIDKSLLTKKLLVVKWTPQKFEIIERKKPKKYLSNFKYTLKDENNNVLENTFFKSDLKLTTPYDRRDSRRGIYSYQDVKDLDIKLNPKGDQAPVERVVNERDREPEIRRSRRNRREEDLLTSMETLVPRTSTNRQRRKYKIDDFEIGDKVDVRYRQELDKYDRESNRFIRSKNFEDAVVVGVDEDVANPIYVDFGEVYGNNRYDSVALSQITKLVK